MKQTIKDCLIKHFSAFYENDTLVDDITFGEIVEWLQGRNPRAVQDILANNLNVQKAINRGWRLLPSVHGHEKVVLAAPVGYRVREYGMTGGWDYVWGDIRIDGNGITFARATDCRNRYNLRSYYERLAKEMNKNK